MTHFTSKVSPMLCSTFSCGSISTLGGSKKQRITYKTRFSDELNSIRSKERNNFGWINGIPLHNSGVPHSKVLRRKPVLWSRMWVALPYKSGGKQVLNRCNKPKHQHLQLIVTVCVSSTVTSCWTSHVYSPASASVAFFTTRSNFPPAGSKR